MRPICASWLLILLAVPSCGGSKSASPAAPSTTTSPTTPPATNTPAPPNPLDERATIDRPDEAGGSLVKILYVLPSDSADRQLDQNDALATSFEAMQRWLETASNGQRVRLDTFQGAPDIAFVRLARTDASISVLGVSAIVEMQLAISNAGFADTSEIYAVYYGGNNTAHCGLSGRSRGQAIGAAFLEATPAGVSPCPQQTVPSNRTPGLTTSPDRPGYWEYVMAHEIFHMLGAVASCAPNWFGGHVGDSPTDLMGVFTRPGVPSTDPSVRWNPSVIDFNRDDYYRHGRACTDVSQSPYLTPPR